MILTLSKKKNRICFNATMNKNNSDKKIDLLNIRINKKNHICIKLKSTFGVILPKIKSR